MGMGEPLANFGPTWDAVTRLHDDFGISARRITVSTVGIVPGMRRMAAEELPVTLAVSLHAPNDALRETMIPINARYPLREVVDAAHAVAVATVAGSRSSTRASKGSTTLPSSPTSWPSSCAPRAARYPREPHPAQPHRGLRRPGRDRAPHPGVRRSARRSRAHSPPIRRNRGTDIDAACGQLRERANRDDGARVDKNAPVNEYRFLNPSQPQTLVNATILCYIQAFFGLIGSGGLAAIILISVGQGVGGFGIANEKRWGYGLALGQRRAERRGLAATSSAPTCSGSRSSSRSRSRCCSWRCSSTR